MSDIQKNEASTVRAKGLATVEYVLNTWTDDQRLELFRRYCVHCGARDPRCQCWNDE